MIKKTIAIIGGGPAAMLLAATLDKDKFAVAIYERNSALGRKLLVAGEGGLNLTHSEETEKFISRYTPASFFAKIIPAFSNRDLRNWLASIGIGTFIGSSKRVFPEKGIKPIDVLTALLEILKKNNVAINTQHLWKGWTPGNELIFAADDQTTAVNADIVVFALGGASWQATGSDGAWTNYFSAKGIEIVPFQASNCAYEVKWGEKFIETAAGRALKNIVLKCEDQEKKGEVIITRFGLEGGAIYALSPQLRKQLNENKTAQLFIDLKPQLSSEQIKDRFARRGKRSIKELLIEKLHLDDTQIELLKTLLPKDEFTNLELLAGKLKNLPLAISAAAPIDEAISTVGGISLDEIDENFQLKKLSRHYALGEMLDWDAPTGGYLLQGCFSMGYYLGRILNDIPPINQCDW